MTPEMFKYIGAGLATFGFVGSGIGPGTIFGNYLRAVSRNPASAPKFPTWLFVGFALVEAFGIFALLIALMIMFVI